MAFAKSKKETALWRVTFVGRVAGRKNITVSDPRLLRALNYLIDGETRGDPEFPLRWICKSTRAIALQLRRQQHPISHVKVAQLLHEQNYSLQSNRKTEEGSGHP